MEEKVLLTWKAPARPFKKRNREFYTTVGAIVFLLVVILLFLREWLLIGVLMALAFVSYALAAVSPEEVEQVISSKGIVVAGKVYEWTQLGRFWFEQKWGQEMLVVEVKQGFPSRLMLLLGQMTKERVQESLDGHLTFGKPEATWVDKASSWLTKKFPLDTD